MQREDTRQRIMGRDDKNSTISLTNFRQERHQDERLFGWNLSLFAMAMILFTSTCLLVTSPVLAAPVCPPIKYNMDVDKVGLCQANGSFSIWDCGQCPHGLGLSVECGRIYKQGTKIHCVTCKKGLTYSDKNDIGQCKPCTRCQENEIIKSGECTPDKDTIKCQCKPGFYRDTWEHCKPCSWCCGDNSNKHVTECKNLEKKCSIQFAKSCAPTTPPPTTSVTTTAATTTGTAHSKYPPTTETSSSLSSASKTEKSLGTREIPNRQRSSTGPTINEKESATGKSRDKGWINDILLPILVIIFIIVVVIFILSLAVWCHRKRYRNSFKGDSAQVSRSTSTTNELNSSAQLLSKDEERGRSTKDDDEKTCTMNGRVEYENGAVKVRLLNAPVSQESVEDSIPGTSEDVSLSIQDGNSQNAVGQLCKEQKLDLAVTQIPYEIYGKVCVQLDAKDPFFRDYRLLAEQLGVTKKQTDVLPINSTDSLLINRMPKVRRLMDILKKIEREDVMKIIEEWLGQ